MSRRVSRTSRVRVNNAKTLLDNLPQITVGVNSSGDPFFEYPLTTNEKLQLLALKTEAGEPLLDDREKDAAYQLVSMIIQLKYGKRLMTSDLGKFVVDAEEEDEEEDGGTGTKREGTKREGTGDADDDEETNTLTELELIERDGERDATGGVDKLRGDRANNFNLIIGWLQSVPWIIPEETVHESPLMAAVRLRVAIHILELEQEPKVEEGSITCRNRTCKSKKIITQYVQTKGNDESFTAFHTCTNCGKHFKGT